VKETANVAVVGAGIVGICSAYFLKKSGFNVTLIDKNEPGSMTSYGHACTFADYASVPVNSPNLFYDIPFMLTKKDSPLSLDFMYVLKNLSWCFQFLKNCKAENVQHISSSLGTILRHASIAYDEIFSDIDVKKYIKNEETLYLYKTEKAYNKARYSTSLRLINGVNIKELSKKEINDLEPNLAPVYFNGQLYIGSRYTTNPYAISKKIFNTFITNGGIYIKSNVFNVEQSQSKITLTIDTNKKDFDKLVVTSGAWSNIIANYIGDNFPLETERGYHVLFDNKNLINRPIGWSHSGFYLVEIEEGIRAAGTIEIAGLNKPPNQKRIKMIETQARKILPQLGKIKKDWIGFRPTLPDSMPVIGPSQKNNNIIYGFGHQHIGWTLAAITGKLINSLCQNSKTNININPFSANRFN